DAVAPPLRGLRPWARSLQADARALRLTRLARSRGSAFASRASREPRQSMRPRCLGPSVDVEIDEGCSRSCTSLLTDPIMKANITNGSLRSLAFLAALAAAAGATACAPAVVGAGAGAAGTAYLTSRGAKAAVKGTPDRLQTTSEQ